MVSLLLWHSQSTIIIQSLFLSLSMVKSSLTTIVGGQIRMETTLLKGNEFHSTHVLKMNLISMDNTKIHCSCLFTSPIQLLPNSIRRNFCVQIERTTYSMVTIVLLRLPSSTCNSLSVMRRLILSLSARKKKRYLNLFEISSSQCSTIRFASTLDTMEMRRLSRKVGSRGYP